MIQYNKLPGLSFIRTIAAFSVLLGHMWAPFGDWGIAESNRIWLPALHLPVTTFFVISGFLITWGLMRDQDTNGDVSVVNAYFGRYYVTNILFLTYSALPFVFLLSRFFNASHPFVSMS